MNPSTPPPGGSIDPDALLSWMLLIGLSLWGGFASFMRKMGDGHVRPFNFTELIGELTIAGFTGVITSNLCEYMGVPAPMKYALVGISSHMGSRLLFKFESMLNAKFNLPPDVSVPTAEAADGK